MDIQKEIEKTEEIKLFFFFLKQKIDEQSYNRICEILALRTVELLTMKEYEEKNLKTINSGLDIDYSRFYRTELGVTFEYNEQVISPLKTNSIKGFIRSLNRRLNEIQR